MFLGQFQHGFDDKGRLTIPARFLRELPETGAVIVQGLDHNLWVLPTQSFQKLLDHLSGMSLTDPVARQLRHVMLGTAQEVIPDRAGRILLQTNLKDCAELKEQVVFVGAGDYFEIWSTHRWQAEQLITNEAVEQQRFATLQLTTR